MKNILIFFHDFEINSNSTRSISRLLGSVIRELETAYSITYFTFLRDYMDDQIKTPPALMEIPFTYRIKQKLRNSLAGKKLIKEFHLRRKTAMDYVAKNKRPFDIIIVLGLDDVNFLRTQYPSSVIIYWIHGISAIYKRAYLQHINKINYLWSPTKTVYRKIVEELHPVPLLAKFELVPNWADDIFSFCNDKKINELRKRYAITPDSKVFIFCGGDIKLKGWFLIEDAFKKLAETNSDHILAFVTGGVVRNDKIYRETIRVICAGTLEPEELSSYYRIAEFGLFPSLGGYEHAPVTLIEMIKANVLPIASDVGGIQEMLGKDYPFLIDAPHSVDAWVDKIKEMIALDNDQRGRLLLSMQQKMQEYKRPDFKILISNILTLNGTNEYS